MNCGGAEPSPCQPWRGGGWNFAAQPQFTPASVQPAPRSPRRALKPVHRRTSSAAAPGLAKEHIPSFNFSHSSFVHLLRRHAGRVDSRKELSHRPCTFRESLFQAAPFASARGVRPSPLLLCLSGPVELKETPRTLDPRAERNRGKTA